MNPSVKEYDYYFRLERYLWPFILCIFASLYFLYFATTGRGLRILRFIRLNPEQASVFCFVLGILMMVINIWFIASSLLVRKKLMIYDNRIIIPLATTGNPQTIFFNSIAYIAENEISKQRIATIVTKHNKRYFINMNLLDSVREYEEILSFLREQQQQRTVG